VTKSRILFIAKERKKERKREKEELQTDKLAKRKK